MKYYIVFAVSIFLLSCSQEPTIENISSKDLILNKNLPFTNPFEEYGIMHNEKLEEFYTDYLSKQKISAGEITDYFSSNGMPSLVNDGIFPIKELVIEKSLSYEDYFNGNHNLDNMQIQFSEEFANYAIQMVDILDSETEVNIKLLDLEYEIFLDGDISELDKNSLLYGLAIARHSFRYWESNAQFWDDAAKSGIFDGVLGAAATADAGSGFGYALAAGVGVVAPPAGVSIAAATAGIAVTASAGFGLATWLGNVAEAVGNNTGWW